MSELTDEQALAFLTLLVTTNNPDRDFIPPEMRWREIKHLIQEVSNQRDEDLKQ